LPNRTALPWSTLIQKHGTWCTWRHTTHWLALASLTLSSATSESSPAPSNRDPPSGYVLVFSDRQKEAAAQSPHLQTIHTRNLDAHSLVSHFQVSNVQKTITSVIEFYVNTYGLLVARWECNCTCSVHFQCDII
jgi:hypothetical protein